MKSTPKLQVELYQDVVKRYDGVYRLRFASAIELAGQGKPLSRIP